MKLLCALVLALCAATPASLLGQQITLEQIMSDPEWIGRAPQSPYWADDSATIFFSQKRQGQDERDLHQINLTGELLQTITDEDRSRIDSRAGDYSANWQQKIYSRNGDLFIKNIATGLVTQLTRTNQSESSPRFIRGDNRIMFTRAGATLIRDLTTGLIYQPAALSASDDPQDKKDPKENYLKDQQQRLFDIVQENKQKQELSKDRTRQKHEADPLRVPPPFYLGKDNDIRGTYLSPDARYMLVRIAKKNPTRAKADAMPNYVTTSGYVESRSVRSKVGTGKPTAEKLILLDLETREQFELDLSVLPMIADDPLAAVKEEVKAWQEERSKQEQETAEQEDDKGPFASVQSLMEVGEYTEAQKKLDGMIASPPPDAVDEFIAEALYLRAQCKVEQGHANNALYDYEKVLENHTKSQWWEKSIERQTDIATRYLTGKPHPDDDLENQTPQEIGVELLIRAAERVPGSPLAERATVELCRYYYESGETQMVALMVEVALDNFPDSAHRDQLLRWRIDAIASTLEKTPDNQDLIKDLQAAAKSLQELTSQPDQETQDDPKKSDKEKPTKPRPISIRSITWSKDSSRVFFQAFSDDNKDRWLATIDLTEHTIIPLEHDRDQAWVNWRATPTGWLRDNHTIWFMSERDGYANIYLRDVALDSESEQAAMRLAGGDFVISSVRLSRDGQYLYYTANTSHPGIYEYHRVNIEHGESEQLTNLGGINRTTLSPDETRLLITHSTMLEPPELYIQDNRPGAKATRLTHTISEQFAAMPWVKPTVVEVPSRHGRPIYSRIYTPDAQPASPRPAVVFIHGAGYLQNAHHGWSNYFREFMFHTLLVNDGYIVLDMDYRASAGYGRDWRTAIYRQMGIPELEDLEDGVAYLTKNHNVDPARIGVYGGSYGGFLTLMALFNNPDLFACGAALRPVTDWAHYNNGYTSNILNTPDLDPIAYERSSPIEFAAGLKNPLLMCHGMQDDNVFFQDTIRLAQRLIELKKENWEIALFPIEPHGFKEPTSWLNEYRRIRKLFEENLGK